MCMADFWSALRCSAIYWFGAVWQWLRLKREIGSTMLLQKIRVWSAHPGSDFAGILSAAATSGESLRLSSCMFISIAIFRIAF